MPCRASTAETPASGPLLSETEPAGGLLVEKVASMDPSTPILNRVFTLQIDPAQIRQSAIHTLALPKGSASFHDVLLPHMSPPNTSTTRRRAAWICRYVAAETKLVPVPPASMALLQCAPWPMGEDYELMLVRGAPALGDGGGEEDQLVDAENPPPRWLGRRTDGGNSRL